MEESHRVVDRKFILIKRAAQLAAEEARFHGIAEEKIEGVGQALSKSLARFCADDAAFEMLESFASNSDEMFMHGIIVCLYSILIMQQLKWDSPQNLLKGSIAALLHDIGEKEIDCQIRSKARHERTFEEVRAYERHCVKGAELLSTLKTLSSEVPQIVLQHHENSLGQGFPAGRGRKDIHPLARVIAVADAFSNLSRKSPKNPEGRAFIALEQMFSASLFVLDMEAFVGLGKVFQKER